MKMKNTKLLLGTLAFTLLLALSSCSPDELPIPVADGILTEQESMGPNTGKFLYPIEGEGFKMEIRQNSNTQDAAEVFFYTDNDLLASVDHEIQIELGLKLNPEADVMMTVKSLNGDQMVFPSTLISDRDNSILLINLDPDVFMLEAQYGLKFMLDIKNPGEFFLPGELILRITGGHVMAENIDGRQLYLAPHAKEDIFGPVGSGGTGTPGNNFGNANDLGMSSNGEGSTGNPLELDNGGTHQVQRPNVNQHGGHVAVENIDGRQIRLRPFSDD